MSKTKQNKKSTYNDANDTYNKKLWVPALTKKEGKIFYRGEKNKTEFPGFIELCKMTQEELKDSLPQKLLDAGYTDIVLGSGYIYATGDIPILLTAHMDTVHNEPVKDFYEFVDEKGNHIISSPQGIGGDDRCGIYMILEIIKEYKPFILFCEDEEIGGIGSDKFCAGDCIKELSELKYLIELDRANANDAVFYDCNNPDFTKFITETTGYKEEYGSFSDISTLAPACGVAAVNLSCGYYHAHTLREEVNVEEMLNTVEVVKTLLITECEQFEYIERYKFSRSSYYGYGRYDDDDYDDDDYYGGYSNRAYSSYSDYSSKTYMLIVTYQVTYQSGEHEEKTVEIESFSLSNAWLKFFRENPSVCWNDVLGYDYDFY